MNNAFCKYASVNYSLIQKTNRVQIKLLVLLLMLGIASYTFAATTQSTTVLVTGTVIDNSKYPWVPNFLLLFPDGYTDGIQVNIPSNETPSQGRFIIPVEVGKNYQVNLVGTGVDFFGSLICQFNIKATSDTNASMQLVASNNSLPILCHYSGNPNNNTATITILNNSTRF